LNPFSFRIYKYAAPTALGIGSPGGVEAQDAMAVVQQRFAGDGLMRGRDGVKPVGPLHDESGGLENLQVFAAHVHAATAHPREFGHGHDLPSAQRAEHPPARRMAEGGQQEFVVEQRSGRVGFFRNGDGFHAFYVKINVFARLALI